MDHRICPLHSWPLLPVKTDTKITIFSNILHLFMNAGTFLFASCSFLCIFSYPSVQFLAMFGNVGTVRCVLALFRKVLL